MKAKYTKFLTVLAALLIAAGAMAQDKMRVSGVVTDETGEPLPGAGVLVDGTSRGEITDIDGNYTIEVSAGESLVFNYIGYKSQTVEIRGGREKNKYIP